MESAAFIYSFSYFYIFSCSYFYHFICVAIRRVVLMSWKVCGECSWPPQGIVSTPHPIPSPLLSNISAKIYFPLVFPFCVHCTSHVLLLSWPRFDLSTISLQPSLTFWHIFTQLCYVRCYEVLASFVAPIPSLPLKYLS